jgi:hypothetical protein
LKDGSFNMAACIFCKIIKGLQLHPEYYPAFAWLTG